MRLHKNGFVHFPVPGNLGTTPVGNKLCLSGTVGWGLPRETRMDSVNDRHSGTSRTVFVGRMKG